MKYTIGSDVADITSAKGTKYKKFNIRGEDKVVTESVVAFSSFSKFAEVVAGAVIEGKLSSKEYQGRTSYTLEDEFQSKGGGGVAVSMERKQKAIAQSQDRKEEGIMISSTIRDAVLIVTARMAKEDIKDWKKEILSVRHWLVENWENTVPLKVAGTDVDYPQNDINADSIPF